MESECLKHNPKSFANTVFISQFANSLCGPRVYSLLMINALDAILIIYNHIVDVLRILNFINQKKTIFKNNSK